MIYSNFFLMKCMALSMEDRGRLITLVCYMHQNGRIDEETTRLLVGNLSVRLGSEFSRDENGLFFCAWLEEGMAERAAFRQTRIQNGSKGGRPKKVKPNENLVVIDSLSIRIASENLSKDVIKDKDVDKDESIIIVKQKKTEKMKAPKGTKTPPIHPEVVLPFQDADFLPVWDQYKGYRLASHKFVFKAPESEQLALKKLFDESGGNKAVAIKMIENSIARGWMGIFPDKNFGSNGTEITKTGKQTGIPSDQQLHGAFADFYQKGGSGGIF